MNTNEPRLEEIKRRLRKKREVYAEFDKDGNMLRSTVDDIDWLIAEIERLREQQQSTNRTWRDDHVDLTEQRDHQRRHRNWALKKARRNLQGILWPIYRLRLETRTRKAEAELAKMIELEASVCPEDFGCHEYIPVLEARVKELEEELKEARRFWWGAG